MTKLVKGSRNLTSIPVTNKAFELQMVINSDIFSLGAVVVITPEVLKVPLLLNRSAGD